MPRSRPESHEIERCGVRSRTERRRGVCSRSRIVASSSTRRAPDRPPGSPASLRCPGRLVRRPRQIRDCGARLRRQALGGMGGLGLGAARDTRLPTAQPRSNSAGSADWCCITRRCRPTSVGSRSNSVRPPNTASFSTFDCNTSNVPVRPTADPGGAQVRDRWPRRLERGLRSMGDRQSAGAAFRSHLDPGKPPGRFGLGPHRSRGAHQARRRRKHVDPREAVEAGHRLQQARDSDQPSHLRHLARRMDDRRNRASRRWQPDVAFELGAQRLEHRQ